MTFKHLYGSISLVGRKVCKAVKYSLHSFGDGAKREKEVDGGSIFRPQAFPCFSVFISIDILSYDCFLM